jgi:NAD(P)H-flavin reductase
MLEACLLGDLADVDDSAEEAGSHFALHKDRWTPFRLVGKAQATKDSWRYRFALPDGKQALWDDAPCQHLQVRADVAGVEVLRPYTPLPAPAAAGSEAGHVDLLVKLYEDGRMSHAFAGLELGSTMDMRGPRSTLR